MRWNFRGCGDGRGGGDGVDDGSSSKRIESFNENIISFGSTRLRCGSYVPLEHM